MSTWPWAHRQPWGGFKQRKWDPSSQLSAGEQRAELVAAYIDEDVLDPELLTSPMSRIPTDAEVAEILSPWRPEKLRRIAAAHLTSHAESYYILRTHYGGGAADDARLRDWIDDAEGPNFEPPENEWFCVLDDAELFDFGDYWQCVYDALLELAAPKPDRRFTADEIAYARERAQTMAGCEQPGDEYLEAAILLAAKTLPPWLLVLDKEAFETEELGLIFRDKKGNPVKETELAPDEMFTFRGALERGMLPESGHWEYGRVGRKYRIRGEIMRQLLPLVRGDSVAQISSSGEIAAT